MVERGTNADPEAAENGLSARRRVIIVGAGQTGRAIERTLSENWDIALVDIDPVRLERLEAELPDRSLRYFAKDGMSLLNLKEAGLHSTEWLVAVTNRDDIDTEACRVALSIADPRPRSASSADPNIPRCSWSRERKS
jgi:Trk K+ transport system NAD-binding subunit